MSARHRQHKRKLTAAQKDLAERQVDLVSYARVIANMTDQGLPPQTRAPLVIACSAATRRDCERLRKVVEDLEMKLEERTSIDVRPASDDAPVLRAADRKEADS